MIHCVWIIVCCCAVAYAEPAGEVLCTEVLRLYPHEFIDQTRWWELCNEGATEEELIAELNDPLVRDAEETAVSAVSYRQYEISAVGVLKIEGFFGAAEFIEQFDAELEKARYDDGLILDLRGAGGGEVETAYHVFARLINAPVPGLKIKTRIPGSEDYKEVSHYIRPRGDWQFENPVVMLVDQDTHWPSEAILYASRERTLMETVGYPTIGTKGVAPRIVAVSDYGRVQIPTAVAWTPAGVKLTGQPFLPGINLAHEPRTVYRDPRDPILSRGADEVFRMIGRLEWLREEQRKRMIEDEEKRK